MKYAEKFKANTSKWHFLTGTRAQITELAVKSFKLGSIEEPVFHSPKFALVDRKGWIRGYYDGVQSGEVSQLFSDIASLLKEK
jgi:protein SCO1/2